jgi:hypothetical protein
MAAFSAVATVLVLCGCQSTQERSAELQRKAKHELLASQGVSVIKENPSVKVLQSTLLHSGEGTAVVVALRNTSSRALENAPIEITVRDAKGGVVFQNDAAGLEPSLTTVSLLEPGRETIWIDDQVQVASSSSASGSAASGSPTSASALVGESQQASASIPQMSITGTHLSTEAGSDATLTGTASNRSRVAQQNLVVYALARKGSKIVAAGRAVLPEVSPGASVPFQIYFTGNPDGAQIQTSAPATTF